MLFGRFLDVFSTPRPSKKHPFVALGRRGFHLQKHQNTSFQKVFWISHRLFSFQTRKGLRMVFLPPKPNLKRSQKLWAQQTKQKNLIFLAPENFPHKRRRERPQPLPVELAHFASNLENRWLMYSARDLLNVLPISMEDPLYYQLKWDGIFTTWWLVIIA